MGCRSPRQQPTCQIDSVSLSNISQFISGLNRVKAYYMLDQYVSKIRSLIDSVLDA